LTAAIYAGRAGLEPLLLEGSLTAGGALMTTTEVENFPGFPDGVAGPDLMDAIRRQAERFGVELVADDAVAVDLTGPLKTVTDSDGTTYQARAVILATGSEYRKLGLADEARLSGRGVSWCATCDGFFFRDKDVAVVGGGDSALEEATFLTRFARSVTLVHRRDQLRGSQAMVQRALADPKITFAWNSVVSAIRGDNRVTGLELTDGLSGERRELALDGVFVAIGSTPRSQLVAGQVGLDADGYVLVRQPGSATDQPGVFACGDLVDRTYRQAITAAGSGCRAALDVEAYLALNP
jgi:thioredoxin reductase (NADPH)